ncbi:MAG: hypothetical protein LUH14_09570 [Clostridiaceae bacterium]|nr:hypothetical protein [Clostridiaceae bacterium]
MKVIHIDETLLPGFGFEEPVIEERFDPDRTILTLSFKKKTLIKTADKNMTKKTQEQSEKILSYMKYGKEYRVRDFCELLGVKESRVREILRGMSDYIDVVGGNRSRRYKRKE